MEALTTYKLIVLYMLDRVDFPLTNTQISNFILEKEYTTYFTLQQTLNELLSSELIHSEELYNNMQYYITDTGKETIGFFHDKLSNAIKEEIAEYFKTNEIALRNETSIVADYYRTTGNHYAAHCVLKEKNTPIVDLTLTVSSKEQATAICANWRNQCEDIFAYLMDHLIC